MKIGKLRVSRPCYDKFWRCPGWAGPGWKFNKRNWCRNGGASRSGMDWGGRWKILGKEIYAPYWVPWLCPECQTLVLPGGIRYIDPTYWWHEIPWMIKWKIRDWKYEREWRRRGR